MEFHVYESARAACEAAGVLIAAQVTRKGDSVLGLATGSTPIPAYEMLTQWYNRGVIDFDRVRTFNLDEYVGIDHKNPLSYHAFMQEHPDVVPIWGIQHEWELDQWLELTERNPRMTPELQAVIDHDRTELSGDFCRSCGYCLPCAAGIDIPQAARMAQLLRRAPYKPYLSDEWREKMHQIKNCIHCNACKSRCPYGLDTPALLQKQLADYDAFYAAHHND